MNVEHERHAFLRGQAEMWHEEQLIDTETERAIVAQLDVPWRAHGVVVQCVFFMLALVGVGASYGLCSVLSIPAEGLVVGVGAIAIAELLIQKKRWFRTGVEAGLWIGGLFSMITELPSSGKPEAMLVFAAAAATAGARMRNPIFGALAAMFVVVYAERKFDAGVVVSIAIASVGLLALLRTWKRPSTEWLWMIFALVLPVVGRFAADERWRAMTITLYLSFGVLALTLAIAKRHHALFGAAAIGLTVAAIDLAPMIAMPVEAKLAAAGVLLLALSYVTARLLRERTAGIVVVPMKLTRADEALEVAGALTAAQSGQMEPGGAETRPKDDGGFGGAGATGEF